VSARFRLRLEQERYTAGDTVSGSVDVLEGGRCRSLEVSLDYNEETEDFLDLGRRAASQRLHEGEVATGASFPFALTIPADALPNYRSANGELYWEVYFTSDQPGRDAEERRRIEVEPAHRSTTTSG
jgi:hypothetical protein